MPALGAGTSSDLAATNKYLAQRNKPRTMSKATKNLPQDAGGNRAKEENQCRFASDDRPNTLTKTVALEIVDGFGKAVLLIASAGAVVLLGIVLATISSLP